MFRTDDPSSVPSQPADEAPGAEGFFRNEDVGTGTKGTVLRASWVNMVQNELEALLDIGVPYGVPAPTRNKADDAQVAATLSATISARLAALLPFPYPPGHIQGFRRSVPDLSVDGSLVDFHPGRARSNGNLANLDQPAGIVRKDIGAAWSPGHLGGGWPSGLAAPSSFDWVFAIAIGKPDGSVDFGWDTDGAASNLLADATGFTTSRIVGIDEPLPGDVVRSFYQYPGRLDFFEWARPRQVGLADHAVDTYTAGVTLSSGAPPGTTARIAVSHTWPQYGVDFGTTMLARYYPAEDPTHDETVDASSWMLKLDYTGLAATLESGPMGDALIFDVYGGGSAAFRAKYANVPATMLGHFNCLGFFWDRLREAV